MPPSDSFHTSDSKLHYHPGFTQEVWFTVKFWRVSPIPFGDIEWRWGMDSHVRVDLHGPPQQYAELVRQFSVSTRPFVSARKSLDSLAYLRIHEAYFRDTDGVCLNVAYSQARVAGRNTSRNMVYCDQNLIFSDSLNCIVNVYPANPPSTLGPVQKSSLPGSRSAKVRPAFLAVRTSMASHLCCPCSARRQRRRSGPR